MPLVPLLENVTKETLDNGLTCLLRPSKRVPLICLLAWINAGYYDEADGETGISHFLEHILFKGSAHYGPGMLAREVRALGGCLNGGTIYDHTYYYLILPRQGLERGIELLADTVIRPLFEADEIEREKGVVVEESRRKFDNPGVVSWEKLIGRAFQRHRIRRWRMGSEEGLRGLSAANMAAFHGRYYVAANTALAVAGDFCEGDARQILRRCFGGMPAGQANRREGRRVEPLPEREPPQSELRYLELQSDIQRSYLKLGFHAPAVFEPDYPEARLLAHVLGRGRTSRLYHRLRERESSVDTITSSLYSDSEVGFFSVEAVLDQANLDLAQRQIAEVVSHFRRSRVEEAELEKAKNVLVTHLFLDQENLLGQTYPLCYFESLGDYRLLAKSFEQLLQVQPEQVLKVAEKILVSENATLLESVPGERAERETPERRQVLQRIWQEAEAAPPSPSLGWDRSFAHPAVFGGDENRPGRSEAALEMIPLSGGIPLLYLRDREIPVVTFACYFRGGRCRERLDQAGITNMMLATSVKGSGRFGMEQIFRGMEGRGSSIRFEATADLFGYSLVLLRSHFAEALEILSDVVLRPLFPQEEFNKEREMTLSLVRRRRDDMFHYPIELFYRALFGVHPYGFSRFGSEETIGQLTPQHLLDWHRSQCLAQNMSLVMVGDIEKEEAIELAERHFASRIPGGELGGEVLPLAFRRPESQLVERRQKSQTAVALGFRTVDLSHSDSYALELLQNILGGQGGRLFESLRERSGLAYTVGAYHIPLQSSGAFLLYAAAAPDQEAQMIKAMEGELKRLCREPVGEKELEVAVAYTLGSHHIALQNSQALAFEHLKNHLSGLGLDEVEAFERKIQRVTREELHQVARRYFDEGQRALGIVRGGAS